MMAGCLAAMVRDRDDLTAPRSEHDLCQNQCSCQS
jgi:hypothetical protein